MTSCVLPIACKSERGDCLSVVVICISCTHTRAHTHTHTRTHTRTHTHTHTHTHTGKTVCYRNCMTRYIVLASHDSILSTLPSSPLLANTYSIHTQTYTCYTHTHTYIPNAHKHTHTHTNTYTHSRISLSLNLSRSLSHTHTHTHIHTYTHTIARHNEMRRKFCPYTRWWLLGTYSGCR